LRSSSDNVFLKNIQKKLRYSSAQINTLISIWNIEQNSSNFGSSLFRASTGDAKAICALINFKDKAFVKTKDEFNNLMNQAGYSSNGAKGSVSDYYKENSYNKLNFVVTVAGPYTLPENMAYYGKNDINGNDSIARILEFARESAKLTFNDPDIKPADYDNDNDGNIDAFHIIYAGYGEEAGGGADCIWAHKFGFTAITFGNKRLNTYSCSPELRGSSGTNITHIGVICHELCHVFGAPDFYDANDETDGEFVGTGNWDLMAGGSWNSSGASPAHINMYQKIKFGWVEPVILTEPKGITNMPNSAENAVAYRYNTSMNGEYFILENRQKVGFDQYIPGSGLLIYRVSITDNDIRNNSVNTGHPQKVYPVCASANTNPTSTPSSYGSINSAECTFG
jgi:M6 family metalloprotease-like protein